MTAVGDADDRVREVRERLARSRFHTRMGIRLDALEPGASELSLEVGKDDVNLMGTLHGGVIASLADAATGIAMLSALEEGRSHLTTSLQLTYLAPARVGDTVTASGRVLKAGSRFGYAEADVRGPDGTLLARASASFTILPERAAQ